jgi:hypothetical protein
MEGQEQSLSGVLLEVLPQVAIYPARSLCSEAGYPLVHLSEECRDARKVVVLGSVNLGNCDHGVPLR